MATQASQRAKFKKVVKKCAVGKKTRTQFRACMKKGLKSRK